MAGRGTALAALVADAHRPLLFLLADFSYGADEYDAEGNEEPKALPEGSETMPYIDESPTMSPQLSARSQESGDGISPTPADGLGTGVGASWRRAARAPGNSKVGGLCCNCPMQRAMRRRQPREPLPQPSLQAQPWLQLFPAASLAGG